MRGEEGIGPQRWLRDISLNTLQVLAGQVLGVFIFLLLSRYLDKDSYGRLSWALAVLTTATTILSLRLEQIVVRDVAAGKDASSLLGLFLFHTIGAAVVFLVLLLVFRAHPLLWWLSFSQLLLLAALPFRQVVTGRSAFGWLVVVGSVSNLVRCLGLAGLVLLSAVSLRTVVVLFTASALVEWLVGFIVVVYRLGVPVRWRMRWGAYRQLIADALPQVGMVVMNAGLARVDWILIGLFSTSAAVAEYSFAYRAYEFSPVPLLVLAPLLLNDLSRGDRTKLRWFKRIYAVAGTVLPLAGILFWSPLMGWLTAGKYGRSDWPVFALLSCSIPFQYFINLYWTEEFAANRLGRIFRITAVTALFVVAGDLVAIPLWGGVGAAAVWTAGMVLQWGGYVYRKISWKSYLLHIDWFLLLFLVLMVNVKLYVKIAAVLIILIVYGRRIVYGRGIVYWRRIVHGKRSVYGRGGIAREIFRQRYILFYVGMLLLALLNLLFSIQSLSLPAFFAFGMGACYWLLALLAAGIIYWFVRVNDPQRLHRTLEVFLLLNSVCMLASFIVICCKAGVINPYTYEGEHRRYFINTGDMITGIGLDGSVSTALISAFGMLYFFYRNKWLASLFCLVTLLLAGSNFVDIMLIVVLLFVFIFRSDRLQKSRIIVSFLLMAVFWAKVSPQNGTYVEEVVKRVDKKNVYVAPVPIPNAKDHEFVERKEVVKKEEMMRTFSDVYYPSGMEDSFKLRYKNYNRSGRWVAMQEMARFFSEHPMRLLLGTGMGHFSSRLAFKTAALGIDGGYPARERYIDPFFRDNYLYLYLYYHGKDEGQHSMVNKPDSVYGQLLCEYGLVGLLLFVVLYAAFFFRHSRGLTYGLPVLLLMGMAFFTEYWFEQLSIVILFELLLLSDKKLTDRNESEGHSADARV